MKVREALRWLSENNSLYIGIEVDETAFEEIEGMKHVACSQSENSDNKKICQQLPSSASPAKTFEQDIPKLRISSQRTSFKENLVSELEKGVQGPIDDEAIHEVLTRAITGIDDSDNAYHAQLLIQHMLRPFVHRRQHMLPSYDALNNLESYFPVLFPYGTGGPKSLQCPLGKWVKVALSVYGSRFANDLEFIFFVYSVLRRKRITGLCTFAPLSKRSGRAIVEVRDLLSSTVSASLIAKRIDFLLRSGSLNASFETLKGSPAFWANFKRKAWAYLTRFGPCQIFLTLSAADITDPYLYCEADSTLTLHAAKNLNTKERADILSSNPVSAVRLFHRRIQSLLKNFLLGETRPFGTVIAYLGRVEQQARFSPHLHMLIWLEKKFPDLSELKKTDPEDIVNFIEMFCTAILPPDIPFTHIPKASTSQSIPPALYVPLSPHGSSVPNPLSPEERYEYLSRPCNKFSFDGSVSSNRELKAITLATQFHKCNNYCLASEGNCRFHFPFPKQKRGSLSIRIGNSGQKRFIALAPRTSPFINSTHPMLTAMNHSNSDVTIITGNSIPESMYVCSYAAKMDKNPLFDIKCIRKIQQLHNGLDDRKLLGSIARNSAGSKSIGAQEAVDYLLENPLTFYSASVKNINTMFLLSHPGALSMNQKSSLDASLGGNRHPNDILPQLDTDEAAAVPSYTHTYLPCTDSSATPKVDPFIWDYIRRPRSLEDLSASEFYELYSVKKLDVSKSDGHVQKMVLLNVSESTMRSTQAHDVRIAQKRRVSDRAIAINGILNIPSRGIADDESPHFAAAALILHVPFRSVDELLQDLTLTERLKLLLDSGEHPRLNQYVSYSHELASALSCPPPRIFPKENQAHVHDLNEENQSEMDTTNLNEAEEEVLEVHQNQMMGLNSIFFDNDVKDPYHIEKQWDGLERRNMKISRSEKTLQLEVFRTYLKDCRKLGVIQAEMNLRSSTRLTLNCELETEAAEKESERGAIDSPIHQKKDIYEFKNTLVSEARTHEQEVWLDMVLSYLIIYYCSESCAVAEPLKVLCEENHPILTNAPGGCGKSWLLKQVDRFVRRCIPCGSQPIWGSVLESSYQLLKPSGSDKSDPISELRPECGRLGRVAVFAPSGVAAANSKGFTFHNGLRSSVITSRSLEVGPSEDVVSTLFDDFSGVSVIVIEEYSMASLTLIAYLDLITRKVRPAYAHKFFGVIAIILTGDGLQLPVINAFGLLSKQERIPPALKEIHNHLTNGVFFLELSESVRQGNDLLYADLLKRVRTAQCTDEDTRTLNTRYTSNFKEYCRKHPEWSNAPILTARNNTVHDFNNAAISQNGTQHGTFHIHNMPILTKAMGIESRRKLAKSFFKKKPLLMYEKHPEKFQLSPLLIIYPGMPIMLRTNLCPTLGLSNGSIGRVCSVIHTDGIQPHESVEHTIERCVGGENSIPSLLVRFPDCYRGSIGALSCEESPMTQAESRTTVLIDPQVIERVRGLPIVPAHAMTMHKSQSLTLPYSIIDPRETFCMGALYVAFSRSPSLERILLISPVTTNILNKFSAQTQTVNDLIHGIQRSSHSLQKFVDLVKDWESE